MSMLPIPSTPSSYEALPTAEDQRVCPLCNHNVCGGEQATAVSCNRCFAHSHLACHNRDVSVRGRGSQPPCSLCHAGEDPALTRRRVMVNLCGSLVLVLVLCIMGVAAPANTSKHTAVGCSLIWIITTMTVPALAMLRCKQWLADPAQGLKNLARLSYLVFGLVVWSFILVLVFIVAECSDMRCWWASSLASGSATGVVCLRVVGYHLWTQRLQHFENMSQA